MYALRTASSGKEGGRESCRWSKRRGERKKEKERRRTREKKREGVHVFNYQTAALYSLLEERSACKWLGRGVSHSDISPASSVDWSPSL